MASASASKQHHQTDSEMAANFAFKSGLRKAMTKTLRGVSEAELRSQSQAVFDRLSSAPFYQSARNVGCYLSMKKGELQTDDIVSDLLKNGHNLYTPYLPPAASAAKSANGTNPDAEPGSENPLMEMLKLYSLEDLKGCPLDKWGILDPGTSRYDVSGETRENVMDTQAQPLDLILLPGVAFDGECNRLGRGKAYYDRFLHQYTSTHPRPLLVALALTPQILPQGEKVPTTPNDFQLDGVVSPEKIIWREGFDPESAIKHRTERG